MAKKEDENGNDRRECPELGSSYPEGFLTDALIRRAISEHRIIRNSDDAQAKYACYELRIGDEVRHLVLEDEPGQGSDLYRVKNIPQDGQFAISPGETFSVYAKEELDIPADVFALAIPVGNLYKLGLIPETSFADPGYHGKFHLILCNYSNRIVNLRVGDPLARLFVARLGQRTDKIHTGSSREMPPTVERVSRPTAADLEKSGEASILQELLKNVDPPHYEHAYVTDRLFQHHRTAAEKQIDTANRKGAVAVCLASIAVIATAVVLGLALTAAAYQAWPSLIQGVVGSLIATVVCTLVVFFVAPLRRGVKSSVLTLLKDRSNTRA